MRRYSLFDESDFNNNIFYFAFVFQNEDITGNLNIKTVQEEILRYARKHGDQFHQPTWKLFNSWTKNRRYSKILVQTKEHHLDTRFSFFNLSLYGYHY